jgi:anti-sigma factor (TIGR02949 family)
LIGFTTHPETTARAAHLVIAAEGSMFTCKDSASVLLEFLDGEMTPEEEQKLQEHLSACPPCVDFLRTYQSTPSLCKRALSKKMPTELSGKLTEFLRARIEKKA